MEKDAFSKEYTEQGFWSKLTGFALAAGREVVGNALKLYYTAQDPACPSWAKAVIVGALGYFISPIDAIADPLPAVGFADDLGVLAMALATVATHITDETRAKAEETLKRWFG